MNFNFELVIFYLVVISGLISLVDILFLAPARRKKHAEKLPMLVEYARSFFPVILVVFLLRSFLFEAYRIPSGSLKPTLLVGDFILVNKFDYGIRLPVIHKKLFTINEPKRGDIVVFHGIADPSMDLIKRVIGVPGDHMSYINKILFINGKQIPQTFVKFDIDQEDQNSPWKVEQKQENLFGIKHDIYQIPDRENDNFYDVIVPPGQYFMMGDNRDDSADSRAWGFMPDEKIIGKATRILISWDSITHPLRLNRVIRKIV